MSWFHDLWSYRVQHATVVRLTTLFVLFAIPFFFHAVWKARKWPDFTGLLIGNLWGLAISFSHEAVFVKSRFVTSVPAGDISLGRLLVAFLVWDFMFYWNHRFSHKVPIAWYLLHYSHHRSEVFGLHISSISPSLYKIVNFSLKVFVLHLVTGLPLIWAFQVAITHFNLQFFSHAPPLAKLDLGPLEYVLNTTAAHAIHHARNKELLDKNFGGLLIIWDVIFGTFVHGPRELAKGHVEYGTVVNPVPKPRWWAYVLGGEFAVWRKLTRRSPEHQGAE